MCYGQEMFLYMKSGVFLLLFIIYLYVSDEKKVLFLELHVI
jgi:hypothetical protein